MPGSADNRRVGGTAVVIIIALMALIFAGYNFWYSAGETGDNTQPSTPQQQP